MPLPSLIPEKMDGSWIIRTPEYRVVVRLEEQEGVEELARVMAAGPVMLEALEYAALKFEEIERKALHWEKTFVATAAAAARWRQLKNQAGACGREARAALARTKE